MRVGPHVREGRAQVRCGGAEAVRRQGAAAAGQACGGRVQPGRGCVPGVQRCALQTLLPRCSWPLPEQSALTGRCQRSHRQQRHPGQRMAPEVDSLIGVVQAAVPPAARQWTKRALGCACRGRMPAAPPGLHAAPAAAPRTRACAGRRLQARPAAGRPAGGLCSGRAAPASASRPAGRGGVGRNQAARQLCVWQQAPANVLVPCACAAGHTALTRLRLGVRRVQVLLVAAAPARLAALDRRARHRHWAWLAARLRSAQAAAAGGGGGGRRWWRRWWRRQWR